MSNHLHVDGDLNELEASVRAIQDSTANVTVDEILTDFKDAHKRSAIHFAALNGRRKVLSYILEHAPGALNAVDEDGRSPLLYAIKANEFATAKLLLDAGADTNVVESNGTSCLHEAAAHGSVRACKALLERGANLNASTKNGTPLHIAATITMLQEKVDGLTCEIQDVNQKYKRAMALVAKSKAALNSRDQSLKAAELRDQLDRCKAKLG
ncbi:hypothetical protein DYB26_003600, partial [Aphanomyces astaci]